jgi:hypothetical protein
MSWFRSSSAISICLLAASSLPAADAALPGYFPADARVVIGLRVRALIDAMAGQGVGQEAQGMISALLAQAPVKGFDPFHDVDEILFASTGEGQNAPSLVVMTGRFDAAALASGGKRYRNALILESRPGAKQATALADANTMLAGDLPLVRAALDRGGKGASIDPDLAARVGALRGRYDIWGAGSLPPGAKLPVSGGEQLQSIDRFGFGVTLAHGLECVADLHVRSPKDMEKLTASLQLLEAMVKAQPAGGSESRFDLRTENGAIHVALSIPEEALKRAIAAQRASPASAAPAPPAAAVAAATPRPPGRTEIVRNATGDAVTVTLPGKR